MLLTEGQNDCHVISHLCKLHQVPHNFGLYDCESDEKAIKKLRALIAGSDKKEVIGIVLDADNPSLAAKWDAVSDRLSKEGYKLPDQPNNKGTIITADKNPEENPKIGIWLMPDNNVNGMLEDFCRGLVGDSAMTFAEDCVKKAQDQGVSTFKNNHHSKAVIHTFLAWQDEPGMPLGQAITAHALDGNKPIAKDFVNFLSILFKE
ncbi:MAG: hypothetical protein GQ582_00685 [Methyloprofundus sp.]|nr:hypothetical protein [Methyloprofundus sp.]